MSRALITGITGQDGSYLAEWLLDQGYEVHGIVRRTSRSDRSFLEKLCADPSIYGKRLFLHGADLTDPTTLRRTILEVAPNEFYHLAGQTHVGESFTIPETTAELTGLLTLRLLEILRDMKPAPKFFHASSSEIFGTPIEAPQTETTPTAPTSPYGCGKEFATHIVRVYRQSHGIFACNGILFNHESPRRGLQFVTRKICRGAAAIHLGLQKELVLGDLTGERDWGHARDYVRGMWLALQHIQPEDFVFATGRVHSVQAVVEQAFATVKLDWKEYVRQDRSLFRPVEPRRLVGNPEKAKRLLNWEPETSFEQLIAEMTQAELTALRSK